ncbi:LysR family transcriptional regulator [Bordetella petrii]|uniref:LysR family transcriptional regulator n=1 Tax=Bordetella petrii TaxID=94624 RepID=UPI001A9649DF|nr:LysR family transcriptional regulator [Bordetella petrii]MBO1112595.1 LysR family transcriptional regulator [Bordetella petrii]
MDTTVLANRLLLRARLRHIQALVKLAELGSVKRAADALGMAQPSVTHVLADLEALLGCTLFHRHSRGVLPTPIGLALLPYARRILVGIYECAEVASAMTTKANAVVRVASIASAISGVINPMLPAFCRQHADVWLTITEAGIHEIGELVAEGSVDIALCRRPAVVPEGWQFLPLTVDRYVVAAGPRHPLAKRRRLDMRALLSETWILIPAPSDPRRAFDELMAGMGGEPAIKPIGTRSLTIIQHLLQVEPLVTILPECMIRQALEARQLVRLDVDLPVACEGIGMLLPTLGADGAAALFADFLSRGQA